MIVACFSATNLPEILSMFPDILGPFPEPIIFFGKPDICERFFMQITHGDVYSPAAWSDLAIGHDPAEEPADIAGNGFHSVLVILTGPGMKIIDSVPKPLKIIKMYFVPAQ